MSHSFPYVAVENSRGETVLRPLLPVTLSYGGAAVETNGLLDTGADVNVLPYHLGITLGGNWEQARAGLQLSGNLARTRREVSSLLVWSDSFPQ